ncbi:MAG: PepSY domain-containing protein [Bacillota bacterium]
MTTKEVLKKFGAPILAGVLVLGGIGGYYGTHALAAQAQQQAVSQTNSNVVGEQNKSDDVKESDSKSEKQDAAALAAKAKITQDEAVKAAKTAYPDYEVKEVSLGEEDTFLVYEVNMVNKAGEALDVKVDAGDSKIIKADKDTGDTEEVGEVKENGSNEQKSEKADQGPDNDNIEVEE